MKTLLILRHAKSDWDQPALADHDRPLNARGKRDAPRMGELLRHEGLAPKAILCSSAKRARKTAELVAQAAGFEGDLQLLEELYAAEPSAYLKACAGLGDDIDTAMVVGHNPGLEELLELLTGERLPLPTAALAQVDLPIAYWAELRQRVRGRLVNLWRPKEI